MGNVRSDIKELLFIDTILLEYSIFLKVSGPKIYSLKISGLLYLYLLKYEKIENTK